MWFREPAFHSVLLTAPTEKSQHRHLLLLCGEWKMSALVSCTNTTWRGGQSTLINFHEIGQRCGRLANCSAPMKSQGRGYSFSIYVCGVGQILPKRFFLGHLFPGPLARGTRFFLNLFFFFFWLCLLETRLEVSVVLYLGYMGNNNKTQRSHRHVIP